MKTGPESYSPGHESAREDSAEAQRSSDQETPFDRVTLEAAALEPTGDAMEDVANFERITCDAPRHFASSSEALRYLVVIRQDFEHRPVPSPGGDPETEAWLSAQIGAIDRILAANGVTATTHREFDDQEVRKAGPYQVMRASLESFEPSGDVPADLQRLIAITGKEFAQRRLDRGETPVEVLRFLIESNQEMIDAGVQPEHGPEARYLVEEIFAIENEVVRDILGESPERNASRARQIQTKETSEPGRI